MMNSIISSNWLRRPVAFLAGAALTLTAACALPLPASATPARNAVAQQAKPKPKTITQKSKPKPKTIARKSKLKPKTIAQKTKLRTYTIAYKMQDLKKSNKRWIQIDLSKQRLIAWEGKKQVYAVIVSTGKRSTPTLPGIFSIKAKYPSVHMKGDGYLAPNVPYTMYYEGFYAIHGAYWHNRFGTPVSHGCTNVAVNHAEWLFNWAKVGTPVVVKK